MLPEILTEIPGPRSRALAAKLERYESRNVTFVSESWPIFWQRASGTNVWDVDGNRFLDLTSAFGVASLGHTNAAIQSGLIAQAGKLLHAMGDVHPGELKAELCARLSALTFERWGVGSGKVILGNSGFEAVEAALKTALLQTGKPGVIAFHGGYHGLGFGAVATSGIPYFREPFRAQLKEFAVLLPYALEGLEERILTTLREHPIGCILVEPVQGRGGCVVPPPNFLPTLRRLCDTHGLLLIADEIYTGLNRTGALFACDHSAVVPDLICLGKALTGGFPLSACVGRATVMDAWPRSNGEALHTSTFLGNPLGCAMALASLEQHAQPGVAQQVRERGARLETALRTLLGVAEVRGLGLMLGAVLRKVDGSPDAARALAIVQESLRCGLLLLADSPESNVLSLAPPFALSDDEIAFTTATLAELLSAAAS